MKKIMVVLICSLSAGCTSNPFKKHPIIEADKFEVFASPRDFDAPGRIYRMQPDGQIFGVTDLKVNIKLGKETIPHFEKVTQLSLSEIFNTIGLANKLPIDGTLDVQKKQKVIYEGINAQREYTDDIEIDSALPATLQYIRIRPDNKYFLIRETISTDEINYGLDKSLILKAGLETEFKALAESDTTLNWQSKNKISLNKKYDKPMRIAYKAERLKITNTKFLGLFPYPKALGSIIEVNAVVDPTAAPGFFLSKPLVIKRKPMRNELDIPEQVLMKP